MDRGDGDRNNNKRGETEEMGEHGCCVNTIPRRVPRGVRGARCEVRSAKLLYRTA